WKVDRSRIGRAVPPTADLVLGAAVRPAVPRVDCRRGSGLSGDCSWGRGELADEPCTGDLCSVGRAGELDVSAHHRLPTTRSPWSQRPEPDTTFSRNRRSCAVPATSLPPRAPSLSRGAASALAALGRPLGSVFRP